MKKSRALLPYKEAQKGEYEKLPVLCRGCTMRGRELIWESFVGSISGRWDKEHDNSFLTLVEEPENRYAPNAVRVVCRGEHFGIMGYIGREYTKEVKRILDSCKCYRLDIADEKEYKNREINLILTWEF